MKKSAVMLAAQFELTYREFTCKSPQDRGKGETSTRSQAIMLLLEGLPNDEVAERLQIGKDTIRQYRSKTIREFEVKNFAELQELFDRYRHIWQPEISSEKATNYTENSIYFHNIPNRIERYPIGRDRDIDRILTSLDRHDLVWLRGLGGCGKTTLLLEIAHRYLATQPARFEAIVYISAQTESLSLDRRISLPARRSQRDIYRQIFTTFGCGEVTYASIEDGSAEAIDRHLHDRLCQLLRQHPTLLIFDNFDTQENYLALRQITHQLPTQTRILVGSRTVFDAGYHLEELKPLATTDAKALVKARLQGRKYKLSDVNIQRIVKYTGGLPLAIEIVVDLTAIQGRTERDLDEFLKINPSPQNLLDYCLDTAIERLQSPPGNRALDILKTIALFPDSASKAALVSINNLDRLSSAFDRAIENLIGLSLIIPAETNRYRLHPIVRTYVDRLLTSQPPLHNQLREKWVEWYYTEFARDYDDTNWQDWQDYRSIEMEWQNICALMDWCFDRSLYQRCLDFWRLLKGFTLFRGYWEEREQWLAWLMQAAEIQEDLKTLPLVRYHQSLTLSYRDESDRTGKAKMLAQLAWESAIDFDDRFYVATHIAALYIRQSDPQSLALAEKLLADAANLKLTLSARDRFVIAYYRGEIAARNKKFELALDRYQQALELAKLSQYQRYLTYTQGRIGGTLTELDRLDEAECLLINVLTELVQRQDARAIAFCQVLLMRLKLKQGNENGWREKRSLAIASFEKLNMQTEAKKLSQMQFKPDR